MLDRLLGASVALLACALAIHLAVQLIASAAPAMALIAAAVGGPTLAGLLLRLAWRRHQSERW